MSFYSAIAVWYATVLVVCLLIDKVPVKYMLLCLSLKDTWYIYFFMVQDRPLGWGRTGD